MRLTPAHIEALRVAVSAIDWFGKPNARGKSQPEQHVTTHRLANEALTILSQDSGVSYHCTQCGFLLSATPTVAKEWEP